MNATEITTEWARYKDHASWTAAAKAACPPSGKIITNRGHGSGRNPKGPTISVYDAAGNLVAKIGWDRY